MEWYYHPYYPPISLVNLCTMSCSIDLLRCRQELSTMVTRGLDDGVDRVVEDLTLSWLEDLIAGLRRKVRWHWTWVLTGMQRGLTRRRTCIFARVGCCSIQLAVNRMRCLRSDTVRNSMMWLKMAWKCHCFSRKDGVLVCVVAVRRSELYVLDKIIPRIYVK